MRIIAGIAKGRGLRAPLGDKTRPTSDKIRGAIFNILGSRVIGARALDLFGGTGALALEAISRGAESAVIVDSDRRAIAAIAANAAWCECARIIRADYRRAIAGMAGAPFDLVFLDPPYALGEAYAVALDLLKKRGALAENCVIIMERSKSFIMPEIPGFEIYDTRAYGDTAVDFARGSV